MVEKQGKQATWKRLERKRSWMEELGVKKFLGSREYLDWLKTDLNVAKIITAQNYKRTKIKMNGRKHTQCQS